MPEIRGSRSLAEENADSLSLFLFSLLRVSRCIINELEAKMKFSSRSTRRVLTSLDIKKILDIGSGRIEDRQRVNVEREGARGEGKKKKLGNERNLISSAIRRICFWKTKSQPMICLSLSLFLSPSVYDDRLFVFQEQFRMIDLVSASTLTTMLVSSLAFLVVTQLPSAMTSKRSRILIGLTSSIVLGLGILILGDVLALFACILSIIAVLPKMRWRVPLIIGSVLAFAHVSRRLILDDPSGYYDVIQVNANRSYQEK
jgi:hypothetical protein